MIRTGKIDPPKIETHGLTGWMLENLHTGQSGALYVELWATGRSGKRYYITLAIHPNQLASIDDMWPEYLQAACEQLVVIAEWPEKIMKAAMN